MKKITVIFINIVLVLSILNLSGCGADLKVLEKALEKTSALKAYDMSIEIIGKEGNKVQLHEGTSLSLNQKSKKGKIYGNSVFYPTYIYGDYSYDEWTEKINPFNWGQHENPEQVASIDMEKLNYTVKSKKKDNETTIFTLKVSKKDIAKLLQNNMPNGYEISYDNYKIDIAVNTKTGYWTDISVSSKFSITYGKETMNGSIEIIVKIIPRSDDYEINIPSAIINTMYCKRADKPRSYIANLNKEPVSFPDEPQPAAENYNDSSNISYFNANYKKIIYDDSSKLLIAIGENSVYFLSPQTLSVVKSLPFNNVSDITADNGILVVYSGFDGILDIYEIASLKKLCDKKIETSYYNDAIPFLAIIDGDNIFYSHRNQWGNIILWNYKTNVSVELKDVDEWAGNYYYPDLILDKTTHTLFVSETGNSGCNVFAFDSLTGVYKGQKALSGYGSKGAFFDGEFFHYSNSYTGMGTPSNIGAYAFDNHLNIVAEGNLTYRYCELEDFTPAVTIFNNEKISIVRGYTDTVPQVAIYDKTANNYIGLFDFFADKAINIGDGKYLLTGGSKKYCAIISIEGLSPLAKNIAFPVFDLSSLPSDNSVKVNISENYDHALVSDGYIFLMNRNKRTIHILDQNSYAHIKTLEFLIEPYSMDAHEGYLVVGMGFGRQFFLYNLSDFSKKSIQCTQSTFNESMLVFQVAIYKNTVYYCHGNQWCDVMAYDILTEEQIDIGNYSEPKLAVDKNDGKLIIAEEGISRGELVSYQKGEAMVVLDLNSGYSGLRFDGAHLHAYGYMFDAQTMIAFSPEKYLLLFPENGYEEILGSLYYDDTVSIFLAKKNSRTYTVVYDTNTQLVLNEIEGTFITVAKTEGGFLAFGNLTDSFVYLEI